MNDYKDMLLDAMKQGISLEDVMKGISDAATAIEKEKAEAGKYNVYDKPLVNSFRDFDDVLDRLAYADKMVAEDVAIVIAHFMCQNVPGFSKALAKEDTDPVKLYTSMLKTQMATAATITEHVDDSGEEKALAMLDSLLNSLVSSLRDNEVKSELDCKQNKSNPYSGVFNSKNIPPLSESDAEKVQNFMKRMGLN